MTLRGREQSLEALAWGGKKPVKGQGRVGMGSRWCCRHQGAEGFAEQAQRHRHAAAALLSRMARGDLTLLWKGISKTFNVTESESSTHAPLLQDKLFLRVWLCAWLTVPLETLLLSTPAHSISAAGTCFVFLSLLR